jgi:hypothetical protein
MTGGPDAIKAALEAATKSKKTQNSAAEPAAGGR